MWRAMHGIPAAFASGGTIVFLASEDLEWEVALAGSAVAVLIAASEIPWSKQLVVAIVAAMGWAALIAVAAIMDSVRAAPTIALISILGVSLLLSIQKSLPGASKARAD